MTEMNNNDSNKKIGLDERGIIILVVSWVLAIIFITIGIVSSI